RRAAARGDGAAAPGAREAARVTRGRATESITCARPRHGSHAGPPAPAPPRPGGGGGAGSAARSARRRIGRAGRRGERDSAGRVALGARAGRRVLRLGRDPDAPWITSRGPRQAHLDGFDLHADVSAPAGDLARLEHLCRYLLRPPIAQERLALTPDGRVLVTRTALSRRRRVRADLEQRRRGAPPSVR